MKRHAESRIEMSKITRILASITAPKSRPRSALESRIAYRLQHEMQVARALAGATRRIGGEPHARAKRELAAASAAFAAVRAQ